MDFLRITCKAAGSALWVIVLQNGNPRARAHPSSESWAEARGFGQRGEGTGGEQGERRKPRAEVRGFAFWLEGV